MTPRIGQHARSIAAQLGFVASGLGYALVPEYATKLAMPGVAFLALREALDSVPLSLVWDEARASPQVDAFRTGSKRYFRASGVRREASAILGGDARQAAFEGGARSLPPLQAWRDRDAGRAGRRARAARA